MNFLKELLKEMEDVQDNVSSQNMPTDTDQDHTTNIHDTLVAFFVSHEGPSEEDIQSFANEHKLDLEDVKQEIYTLLHDLLQTVGKHNDVPDEEFDPDQLEQGINVELEHTDNPIIAKMLAKDHLSEISDYYDRLRDMEDAVEPSDDQSDEIQFKMST